CAPAAKAAVENCALPALNGTGAAFNLIPASKKSTLPVAPAVTVAVKAIVCPYTAGLGDAAILDADAVLFTVMFSAAEVEPRKFASPLYVAVRLCAPAASEEVVNDAAPEFTVPVPITVA